MRRAPDRLSGGDFDVVVVGGGIHGACVARDAALRGMSVALVEQGDFCSATSHNSLKTIHGGIRYLQHLNVRRAALSIREQQILRRTMGDLVAPLRFLMPAYGWAMRGPLATGAGVAIFEALTLAVSLRDGQRPLPPQGRLMGPGRCRGLAPGVDPDGLTGGAIWADAQVALADKAVLAILRDAADHGAEVANYMRAEALLTTDGAATGITVCDQISGTRFDISARQVVNAAGPWLSDWLAGAAPRALRTRIKLVRSMNLVVDRPAPELAIAARSTLKSDSKVDSANRMFFMVPWLGKTVIGTTHYTHEGDTVSVTPDAKEIAGFVAEFNAAYPVLGLTPEDVLYCYIGLTPGDDSTDATGAVLHESRVIDHDDLPGLVSIIGIKWTTARLVAEETVDMLARRHGAAGPCQTRHRALPDFASLAHDIAGLDDAGLRGFAATHIAHSQACHLSDVLLRRTNDLVLARLSPERFLGIADAMADHLGWSAEKREAEQTSVLDRLAPSPYQHRLRAACAGRGGIAPESAAGSE